MGERGGGRVQEGDKGAGSLPGPCGWHELGDTPAATQAQLTPVTPTAAVPEDCLNHHPRGAQASPWQGRAGLNLHKLWAVQPWHWHPCAHNTQPAGHRVHQELGICTLAVPGTPLQGPGCLLQAHGYSWGAAGVPSTGPCCTGTEHGTHICTAHFACPSVPVPGSQAGGVAQMSHQQDRAAEGSRVLWGAVSPFWGCAAAAGQARFVRKLTACHGNHTWSKATRGCSCTHASST